MKKIFAVMIAVAFAFSIAGFAVAADKAAGPAEQGFSWARGRGNTIPPPFLLPVPREVPHDLLQRRFHPRPARRLVPQVHPLRILHRSDPPLALLAKFSDPCVECQCERFDLVACPERHGAGGGTGAVFFHHALHPVERPGHLVKAVDAKGARCPAHQEDVDEDGGGDDRPQEDGEVAQGVEDPGVVAGQRTGEDEIEDTVEDGGPRGEGEAKLEDEPEPVTALEQGCGGPSGRNAHGATIRIFRLNPSHRDRNSSGGRPLAAREAASSRSATIRERVWPRAASTRSPNRASSVSPRASVGVERSPPSTARSISITRPIPRRIARTRNRKTITPRHVTVAERPARCHRRASRTISYRFSIR